MLQNTYDTKHKLIKMYFDVLFVDLNYIQFNATMDKIARE